MIHELKIQPEYFKDVISGKKTFEIRKNDREFKPGDMLALNEYDCLSGKYTGNSCLVWIDYILCNEHFCKKDYVTMAIKPCTVWKHERPINECKYTFDYTVPYATKSEGDTE